MRVTRPLCKSWRNNISILFPYRNLNWIWERKNQRAPLLSLNRFSRKYFRSIFFSFSFFFSAVVNEIFRNTVHANPKSGDFFDLPISHASPKSGIFFGLPGWETFVQQHATVYMDHNFILIHFALWATASKKGCGSLKLEYSVNLRKNQPYSSKEWDVWWSSTP